MQPIPQGAHGLAAVDGAVRYDPAKSLWVTAMAGVAVAGGWATFSWTAVAVFLVATATVLLFGHSLGSHRKLVHESYRCPRWLARLLVWLGVQAGIDGPLGLKRQHDLRDREQRLPTCHPYLRHGAGFVRDAWWQLHCRLVPRTAPDRASDHDGPTARDPFVAWLERTWRLQQLPPALALSALGGWAFVVWGVAARIAACAVGHWLVGWFAHNRGDLRWRVLGAGVQGRNVPFVSLLTMGEGWHNNHHHYQVSARQGFFWWEIDCTYYVLRALAAVGLVWDLHGVPAHIRADVADEPAYVPADDDRPLEAA